MGKIHDHANRGAPIPLGWALDENGDPTTDASAAKKGAIAPFGGPKGYALGIAFEVLVASLAASAIGTDVKGTLDSVNVSNKGDLFIVIAPPHAEGRQGAGHRISGRASAPRRPPIPRIRCWRRATAPMPRVPSPSSAACSSTMGCGRTCRNWRQESQQKENT